MVGIYYTPVRRRKLMRFSLGSLNWPHGQRSWFSWGASAILRFGGEITQPCTGWKSREFLQIIENNFLIQVVEEPRRRGVFLFCATKPGGTG